MIKPIDSPSGVPAITKIEKSPLADNNQPPLQHEQNSASQEAWSQAVEWAVAGNTPVHTTAASVMAVHNLAVHLALKASQEEQEAEKEEKNDQESTSEDTPDQQ